VVTRSSEFVGPCRLRGPVVALALAVLAIGLFVPSGAHAKRLPVRKYPASWEQLRSGENAATERVERLSPFHRLKAEMPEQAHHGHLQLGGRIPSLFERADLERRPSMERGGGAPDTLLIKIAVIRVEFDTDRAGPETTGDGRFMQDNPDSLFIDPPPHNADYFQAHIEAVSRYWTSMTYGGVRFEGDVFPRGEEFGAYRLSDMADYGPENDDEPFNIPNLIRYSRESLIVADADPDLVWSDYDVYFVVHAGSDWQNDVFQNTRFDLPTFSISFSDSELVISDEGDTLSTMITYPETSSQDTFAVGLNGGIAHEMGHQLGLFDIYNVETFAPTVAYYSVMDSGNLASVFVPPPGNDGSNPDDFVEVIGILPTAIGAWSRWLVTFNFGLDPPLIKRDVPRLQLRAVQSRADESSLGPREYKWFRVPISDTEYFMVENRVDDLDGRDPSGAFLTALDQDDDTGVILGPINDADEISHNYDLLVDPGVLIWHIDERQALANLSQGRGLNVVFEKRSVTIEEADGLVDIGNPFSLFPLGTPNEAWHAGNAANFTPTSRPNSNTNLGTPTGISITNIGERDSVITMDVTLGGKPRGWPMEIGTFGTGGRTSTTLVDVDGDGILEVAAAGPTGMFVFRYEDLDEDGEVDVAGAWPAPVEADLPGTPVFTQTAGDFDGDGRMEIVAATDSGTVHVWRADGTPWDTADSLGTLFTFAADAGPTWSPLPADLNGDGVDELYLVTEDLRLRGWDLPVGAPPASRFPARRILGAESDSVGTLTTTLAAADVNGDGRLEGYIAFARNDSVHVQRFDQDGLRSFRLGQPFPKDYAAQEDERVWLTFADVDRAAGGALELVVSAESGYVCVFDATVRPLPGWPRVTETRPLSGPTALGDLDGDGFLEIAVGSGLRTVHAFNYNGTEMPGWPVQVDLVDFPAPGRAPSPAAIADVDADGRQDVVLGFCDFTLRAIAPDGTEATGFPLSMGSPVSTAPAILDANRDGRLDLFIQAGDGQVTARILAGVASASNPQWPMHLGGPRQHGTFDASRLVLAGNGEDAVLDGPVVVYPNPVRSGQDEFRIRYTLGPRLALATQVDIEIFNVAGEKVASRAGTAFASTENEVSIPSDELASGVYFCTVRARSGGRVETHQGKFAVVR
jgi:M6 family metalloprotease-like protein